MSNTGRSRSTVNGTDFRLNGVEIIDHKRNLHNINKITVDGTIVCKNLIVQGKKQFGNSSKSSSKEIGISVDSVETYLAQYSIRDIDQRVGNINCSSKGNGSFCEGIGANSIGIGAHSEGGLTQALGSFSHSEGLNSKSTSIATHTEGIQCIASGPFSHAEGHSTQSLDIASHAEGIRTIASGCGSHSEGGNCYATGEYSHAQGKNTVAFGAQSFASGYATNAISDNSVALGSHSSTLNPNQLSIGNNINNGTLNTKTQHIITPLSLFVVGNSSGIVTLNIGNQDSLVGKFEIVGRSCTSSNTWACVYDAVLVNDGNTIHGNIVTQYTNICIPPNNLLQQTNVSFGDYNSGKHAFAIEVYSPEDSAFSICFTGTQVTQTFTPTSSKLKKLVI